MDAEIKQHLELLYFSLRSLQAQTNKLTVSVRALVEVFADDEDFHKRYTQALRDQGDSAATASESLALERIEAAIQAMAAGQMGQA